jgi:ribokinase
MRILNFGSLNIDHVYGVTAFVRAGETIPTSSYRLFAGGKGFNQSVALARAGARVAHAGQIGEDGRWLIDTLHATGVDTTHIRVGEAATGHAVIQVDASGENCIMIHGGANRSIPAAAAAKALEGMKPGDALLLQNEINGLDRLLERAAEKRLHVILNPSPIDDALRSARLDTVGTFVLNQAEGEVLSGVRGPAEIIRSLQGRFERARIVLTLGSEGVLYRDADGEIAVPAEPVATRDTTGAGDTFLGYFLAESLAGAPPARALRLGCRAAALCVQRDGAADSIPERAEL